MNLAGNIQCFYLAHGFLFFFFQRREKYGGFTLFILPLLHNPFIEVGFDSVHQTLLSRLS